MPPLITREEALRLGEIEDHAEIEALVERAWRARVQRFGDSTDMCSLVNAKSGGCAEDCGFCAQSRFAEAETPMHAMMDPQQILRHAQAAEAAGAHRFCMVTQGQGLSKRDFEKILQGARLVAEHTNLKRCASIGHMSAERAQALREAGIQRVHHNVETAESYYPEVSSTVRYQGRIRTIEAVREAGLETCVGGILNLGESREQRVEMAFQLAEIDPTSVPINLLIPFSGTKFGEREPLDPWEAVKWIAIFRLILPSALLRLCGGRIQNLRELQQLAVKAGINGVMMGNFLTSLGNTPEEDRAMFEEHGLNVAPQPDNGSNPRPDNRSGWLSGETPDIVEAALAAAPATDATPDTDARLASGAPLASNAAPDTDPRLASGAPLASDAAPATAGGETDLGVQLWDPSTQLRYRANGPSPYVSEIAARLAELSELGLERRTRLVDGPQGAEVSLDGRQVTLLCSNNYLGLAADPRVREAAAEAALKLGAGAGASRLISGTMSVHRELERALADFEGAEACVLLGSGYLANVGVIGALAGRGDVVFSDELNHASIVDGCRLSRAEVVICRHLDVEHLDSCLATRRGDGRALIVTDSVFSMDGDLAPLTEIVALARRHRARVLVDEAHAIGAIGEGGRGALAAAGLEGQADALVGTLGKALGSYGAYVCGSAELVRYLVNVCRPLIFSTAPPPPAIAAAHAALQLLRGEPSLVRDLRAAARCLRAALRAEGFAVQESEMHIVPLLVGEQRATSRLCEAALARGVFAQAIRPPTVPAGTSRLRLASMASHSQQQMRSAARSLREAAEEVGLDPARIGEPSSRAVGALAR